MNTVFEILIVALLTLGSFFVLAGSLGLFKLSDFYKRLHGPTKASTMGVGCMLLASIGARALSHGGLDLRELMITAFLFITAPVSAMMMARAALAIRPKDRPEPPAADGRGGDA
ncbi:Na+/H+ antiporter subunit G [Lysobacter pythonis]|uniref:Na+/H+ antiporter subunit G n=1 Tax=Solilutibacter pythonis TaxID=2483112 RepID=A0A3M2HUG3_9GAMM|nr:Na+/H+ antiporter subunit G [Lysobacter pythonis]RMH93376.1 Na+/H+ antiporter subunit G [Lysobacter pythonis]